MNKNQLLIIVSIVVVVVLIAVGFVLRAKKQMPVESVPYTHYFLFNESDSGRTVSAAVGSKVILQLPEPAYSKDGIIIDDPNRILADTKRESYEGSVVVSGTIAAKGRAIISAQTFSITIVSE